jgi:hypothetical protein
LVSALPALSQEEEARDPNRIEIPVPIGEDVLGLRIPFYDESGDLQVQLAAKVARKTSDETVEMEELDLEVFDEDGRKLEIELPQSALNLSTRTLNGTGGVVIKRDDFLLEGDSVVFEIRQRSGQLSGNIRMLIYSLESLNE